MNDDKRNWTTPKLSPLGGTAADGKSHVAMFETMTLSTDIMMTPDGDLVDAMAGESVGAS